MLHSSQLRERRIFYTVASATREYNSISIIQGDFIVLVIDCANFHDRPFDRSFVPRSQVTSERGSPEIR